MASNTQAADEAQPQQQSRRHVFTRVLIACARNLTQASINALTPLLTGRAAGLATITGGPPPNEPNGKTERSDACDYSGKSSVRPSDSDQKKISSNAVEDPSDEHKTNPVRYGESLAVRAIGTSTGTINGVVESRDFARVSSDLASGHTVGAKRGFNGLGAASVDAARESGGNGAYRRGMLRAISGEDEERVEAAAFSANKKGSLENSGSSNSSSNSSSSSSSPSIAEVIPLAHVHYPTRKPEECSVTSDTCARSFAVAKDIPSSTLGVGTGTGVRSDAFCPGELHQDPPVGVCVNERQETSALEPSGVERDMRNSSLTYSIPSADNLGAPKEGSGCIIGSGQSVADQSQTKKQSISQTIRPAPTGKASSRPVQPGGGNGDGNVTHDGTVGVQPANITPDRAQKCRPIWELPDDTSLDSGMDIAHDVSNLADSAHESSPSVAATLSLHQDALAAQMGNFSADTKEPSDSTPECPLPPPPSERLVKAVAKAIIAEWHERGTPVDIGPRLEQRRAASICEWVRWNLKATPMRARVRSEGCAAFAKWAVRMSGVLSTWEQATFVVKCGSDRSCSGHIGPPTAFQPWPPDFGGSDDYTAAAAVAALVAATDVVPAAGTNDIVPESLGVVKPHATSQIATQDDPDQSCTSTQGPAAVLEDKLCAALKDPVTRPCVSDLMSAASTLTAPILQGNDIAFPCAKTADHSTEAVQSGDGWRRVHGTLEFTTGIKIAVKEPGRRSRRSSRDATIPQKSQATTGTGAGSRILPGREQAKESEVTVDVSVPGAVTTDATRTAASAIPSTGSRMLSLRKPAQSRAAAESTASKVQPASAAASGEENARTVPACTQAGNISTVRPPQEEKTTRATREPASETANPTFCQSRGERRLQERQAERERARAAKIERVQREKQRADRNGVARQLLAGAAAKQKQQDHHQQQQEQSSLSDKKHARASVPRGRRSAMAPVAASAPEPLPTPSPTIVSLPKGATSATDKAVSGASAAMPTDNEKKQFIPPASMHACEASPPCARCGGDMKRGTPADAIKETPCAPPSVPVYRSSLDADSGRWQALSRAAESTAATEPAARVAPKQKTAPTAPIAPSVPDFAAASEATAALVAAAFQSSRTNPAEVIIATSADALWMWPQDDESACVEPGSRFVNPKEKCFFRGDPTFSVNFPATKVQACERLLWIGSATSQTAKIPQGDWRRKREPEAWQKMVSAAITRYAR